MENHRRFGKRGRGKRRYMQGVGFGINSAKIASDQVEGMGFAIPISLAKPILAQLMAE